MTTATPTQIARSTRNPATQLATIAIQSGIGDAMLFPEMFSVEIVVADVL